MTKLWRSQMQWNRLLVRIMGNREVYSKFRNPVLQYLITRSLTHSWSWALLEKPPIVLLLKHFPTFYGTRRFITVFTRAILNQIHPFYTIPSYLSKIHFTYVLVFLVVSLGSLSPRHGASAGCGWKRRPPGMEGSCEYIEQAVADSRRGWASSLGVERGVNNSSP
jgi:hypothetical protein